MMRSVADLSPESCDVYIHLFILWKQIKSCNGPDSRIGNNLYLTSCDFRRCSSKVPSGHIKESEAVVAEKKNKLLYRLESLGF